MTTKESSLPPRLYFLLTRRLASTSRRRRSGLAAPLYTHRSPDLPSLLLQLPYVQTHEQHRSRLHSNQQPLDLPRPSITLREHLSTTTSSSYFVSPLSQDTHLLDFPTLPTSVNMRSPSPNSRSSSIEPSATMQIFIKPISGQGTLARPASETRIQLTPSPVFPLTVPTDLSISHLTTLLSVRTSLPEDSLRLVYAGKHLSSISSLADHNITREATIHLASPLRGGMPPKKIRCTYKDCKEGAQRIIGDCGFCQGHYCGKHRLLEDHKCDGLEDVSFPCSWLLGLESLSEEKWLTDTPLQCKKESHDRNAAQLNAERTQVIKGI